MDERSTRELLRDGVAAAKSAQQHFSAGEAQLGAAEQERAKTLLLRVTDLAEQNILAWLWLSTVVDAPEDKRTCLENVLALEPANKHALAGLARLQNPQSIPKPPPIGTPSASKPKRRKYTRLKPRAAPQAKANPSSNIAEPRPFLPGQSKGSDHLCPFCQQPISTIDKRCAHCQLPLIMRCPACETDVDVEQTACPQCDRALGNFRQPVTYFAELGAAYQQHKRHQEAVKAWQAVETLESDHPQLHLQLGQAHLGTGRPDRAWSRLQRALEETPDAVKLHFTLGELTRQRGERQQAYEHYYKVIQREPGHGLAWFRLAQILQQANKRKEATQAYRKAQKLLSPGTPEYDQLQIQMERLNPSLPEHMITSWAELLRQMTGPILLCVLAALLDSGLRPWWIPITGWLALLLAVSGTFLCVSVGLPRNPLVRLLVGREGLSSESFRIAFAVVGTTLWVLALVLILLPVGQTYPELPQL